MIICRRVLTGRTKAHSFFHLVHPFFLRAKKQPDEITWEEEKRLLNLPDALMRQLEWE
jgi:hypothetical protein